MITQSNFAKVKFLLFVLFTFYLTQDHNYAQTKSNDVVIGKTLIVDSKILNEQRNIFVNVPAGYELSKERYPVIYILDGGVNFAFSSAVVNFLSRNRRIPRSIVIGIPNTDRTRDFTPINVKEWATSGGADKFLEFMEKELISFIDDNYRTQPYKTLFGHSLCGMFSIYTLFERPELFDSYIAVSPFLQFGNQYVLDRVESILSEHEEFKKSLFITLGNEPTYTVSIERLEKFLSEKTEYLLWEISKRNSEDHGSVPLKSLYDGLEFIYSDWRLTNEIIDEGIIALKEHYFKLSDKYGYKIYPDEFVMNIIGYRYMGNDEYDKAIEIFRYNVEMYPNSANVYDSLGEAFEKMEDFTAAKENYQMAVNNGEKLNDRNLEIYRKNLDRVRVSK